MQGRFDCAGREKTRRQSRKGVPFSDCHFPQSDSARHMPCFDRSISYPLIRTPKIVFFQICGHHSVRRQDNPRFWNT
jgi:hypothetical protein